MSQNPGLTAFNLTLEAGLPWDKVRLDRILIQTNVCSLLAKVTDRKAKSIKNIYPSIYSILARAVGRFENPGVPALIWWE
jgi:hypothetical protein